MPQSPCSSRNIRQYHVAMRSKEESDATVITSQLDVSSSNCSQKRTLIKLESPTNVAMRGCPVPSIFQEMCPTGSLCGLQTFACLHRVGEVQSARSDLSGRIYDGRLLLEGQAAGGRSGCCWKVGQAGPWLDGERGSWGGFGSCLFRENALSNTF
jgi:hypothetical protein